MWPFSWFKRQREKHETVEEVYEKRGVDIHQRPPRVRRVIERRYSALAQQPQQSSDDGLLTGFLLGQALGSPTAPPVEEAPTTPAFEGFGGGESGGAGASGSWDAHADPVPSCSDTSTDSSTDSSSSSCDSSSSSDSGSSGSSDF